MRAFWAEPYLWVHLAGLAALPVFLELTLVGLAIGDPILPVWLELLLVGGVGLVPIFWMQWQRPFYIFSLMAVALKPEQLTSDQLRVLTLFKAPRTRILAVVGAIVAVLVLRQIYSVAAIAAEVVPFADVGRGIGLLLAAVAFLVSHLFLQVPLSVAGVMLTGDTAFAATTPYPVEQVRQAFTVLGLPVNRILPPVIAEPAIVASDGVLNREAAPPTQPMSVPDAAVISTQAGAEATGLESAAAPTGELAAAEPMVDEWSDPPPAHEPPAGDEPVR